MIKEITSLYIPTRDKIGLAATIYRPQHTTSYPIVWKHDRYHTRNKLPEDKPAFECFKNKMLELGIAVAVVDSRGSGASFGHTTAPFSPVEQNDMYDITEWFATQAWCSGKIGMFGRSYSGISQYLAAAAAPPHLKIIVPEMALIDLYHFSYPGGIFRHDFANRWGQNVYHLDQVEPAKNVETDSNQELLNQARLQHKKNEDIYHLFSQLPYRDSKLFNHEESIYKTHSPLHYLKNIEQSKIAIFHVAGWQDLWVNDALIAFNNLNNPQTLMIGPWAHDSYCDYLTENITQVFAEHLLTDDATNSKKLANTIHYYVMGEKPKTAWHTTTSWPLPSTHFTDFFLHSHNQLGIIQTEPPHDSASYIEYTVDYTTSSGNTSRWANGYGEKINYDRIEEMTAKSLLFTGTPLEQQQEMTGQPKLHIYIACDSIDFDLFVFLLEKHADGYIEYLTEGCLRASRRNANHTDSTLIELDQAMTAASILPVPIGKPILYELNLLPISKIIPQSHRLQLCLCGCDHDNTLTPKKLPEPILTVFCNTQFSSRLTLPIIP